MLLILRSLRLISSRLLRLTGLPRIAIDDPRAGYLGCFDKLPALIARCTCAADVARTIEFARGNDLVTAVPAGGHTILRRHCG